jgi:Yip1-like protein
MLKFHFLEGSTLMAVKAQEVRSETSNFGSDLAGIPSFLIDPESAARRVYSKYFWIAPVLLAMIIGVAVLIHNAPYIIHAAAVSPVPDGMTSEQFNKMAETQAKLGPYFVPLVLLFYAIGAGLLLAMSAVLGVGAKFGQLFNLIAGCGLIQSLGTVAAAAVLHFKGEVSSMAELQPAMGLDIFLPEGTNKYLVAAGSAFSIFQIWWVVMMVLIFAAAFKVTKGKAFAAVFPLWLLGFCLALVGAAFRK